MSYIFEVIDKSGRKIRLTDQRWNHIVSRHPELSNSLEIIKETVLKPSFQVRDNLDEKLYYSHSYIKDIKFYMIVAVKYLNGEGFIITAFYSRNKKT